MCDKLPNLSSIPVYKSSHGLHEYHPVRCMTERWVPHQPIIKGLACLAEYMPWLGGHQCGINLQVLIHSEELNAVYFLINSQLQCQWHVTKDALWSQRHIVTTQCQQQDVVDGSLVTFFCWEESDPDSEWIWHKWIGEVQVKHASLWRAWSRAHIARVEASMGTPGTHTWFTHLLHIRWTYRTQSNNTLSVSNLLVAFYLRYLKCLRCD